jgi:uncharacterized membrane protein (DUF4010 family)
VGLVGCSAALVSDELKSALPLVIAILVIGIWQAVNYYIEAAHQKTGLTTKTAVILTLLLGAMAYWNYLTLAVALGVVATVILYAKTEMHDLARKVTGDDIRASLKFAVITAIVLPVLPRETYGPPPLDVFNPFNIWLLVVFISGISFVGFILIKLIGPRKGISITGLLGGLASSTALTLSFTQRSKQNQELARPLALAIIIAWIVMFARVVLEVAVWNSELALRIVLPLLIPVAAGLAYSIYLYRSKNGDEKEETIKVSNPFELGPAIKFGLIFTVILAVSKVGMVYFGEAGIYISSFIAGLADVDAIALSLADLSKQNPALDQSAAAGGIVVAAVANTLAKGGIVIFAGAVTLRKAILPGYLLMVVCGLASLILI